MNSTISAVILAAGSSSRMGEPKQILGLGQSTILEHVIQLALKEDFAEVITVIGNEAQLIQDTIRIEDPRFKWVINEEYLAGQSTSLKAGIGGTSELHGHVMVFLGDTPFITSDTIQKVLQRAENKFLNGRESFVIRPTHQGVAGHPVFFGNVDKSVFAQLQGDTGAKPLFARFDEYVQVEVEDDGILFDVDTKEQYTDAKKRKLL